MRRVYRRAAGCVAVLLGLTGLPAAAQVSASFKLTESSLNSGGDPRGAVVLASSSYHVKLDALGEPLAATGLSSASYRSDASFVPAYRPAGEVRNLRFTDRTHFSWTADPAAGTYAVYRDLLSTLPGTFGTCFQSGLTATAAVDAATPPGGRGWFYLVTARNRLREEGTKGFTSTTERTNTAPCP